VGGSFLDKFAGGIEFQTAPKTQPGLLSKELRSLLNVPHLTCKDAAFSAKYFFRISCYLVNIKLMSRKMKGIIYASHSLKEMNFD
jgi:hypothetical protein